MTDWKLITEAAPPDNHDVILFEASTGTMIIGCLERKSYGTWVQPALVSGYEWECDMQDPTHWAPLPNHPGAK